MYTIIAIPFSIPHKVDRENERKKVKANYTTTIPFTAEVALAVCNLALLAVLVGLIYGGSFFYTALVLSGKIGDWDPSALFKSSKTLGGKFTDKVSKESYPENETN